MLNFSPQNTVSLMQAGYAHHMAGRFSQAEQLYRQVLVMDPNHADACHLLGAVACQLKQFDVAIEFMSRAVALNPRHAIFRSNLGETFRQAGQLDRAADEFRQALAIDPHLHDARTNLAIVHLAREEWAPALAALEPVLREAPANVIAQRLSGDALAKLQRRSEALAAYERAMALKPGFVDVQFNMASLLADAGNYEEAAALYRAVIAAVPNDWEARLQLGDALVRLNRLADAYKELTALVEKNPTHAIALSRVANLLRNGDQVDDALRTYARAIELAPQDWITRSNMAFALRDQTRLQEAIDMLREILVQHPAASPTRSGLIFSMYLIPGISRAEIRAEQEIWNRLHGDPVAAQRTPHANVRDPERRLRIGYVSSDLRSHPVGRFMLPLIRNHDRAQFEVYCYRGSRSHDGITDQIARAADHFTAISALTDDDAAAAIRADNIDILIDLNNHTIDNRMLLFARKPAPVQISYLAFCADTGLETIDWRLTDPLIDPPGENDDVPFEKPLRLAETYWCYAATPQAGEVMPLPALAAGHITFGSFNYFSKCNDEVLALWARLLQQMPDARLVMHVPKGSRQPYVRNFFAARGIAPERLTLFGRVSESDYFLQYAKVDIALDTFPWAGGTTTCDALYMGVPVITLAGRPGEPLQRGGVSILTNLGSPEWIAQTPEEYFEKAQALSGDFGQLAGIRAALRGRMLDSVLMDAKRFTRHVEAAYRHAWRAWCDT